LEPLSELAVPPFELSAAPGLSTSSDWFDAETLAMYLVVRGNFFHPISRRELDATDCARLDEHLRSHIPGCTAQVGRAYAHRRELAEEDAAAAAPLDLVAQRRELAASLHAELHRRNHDA